MGGYISKMLASPQGVNWFIYAGTISGIVGFAYYLYRKARSTKIPIPCFGCDPGGSWYSCMPGTGLGSEQCKLYKDIIAQVEEIRSDFQQVVSAIRSLEEAFSKPFSEAKKILSEMSLDFVPNPLKKIADIPIDQLKNLSCGVDIPKLPSVDICAATADVLVGALQIVQTSINAVNKQMEEMMSGITDALTDVFKQLTAKLTELIGALLQPWEAVKDEVQELAGSVGNLIGQLKNNFVIIVKGSFAELLENSYFSIGTTLAIGGVGTFLMFFGGLMGNIKFFNAVLNAPGQLVSTV